MALTKNLPLRRPSMPESRLPYIASARSYMRRLSLEANARAKASQQGAGGPQTPGETREAIWAAPGKRNPQPNRLPKASHTPQPIRRDAAPNPRPGERTRAADVGSAGERRISPAPTAGPIKDPNRTT